jgi:hypothetical protein
MKVEIVKHTPGSPKKKGLHYWYVVVAGSFLPDFYYLSARGAFPLRSLIFKIQLISPMRKLA